MISETMIKFWSRFQIQIFLQFHWRAEKLIKIKLVIAMVKSLDESHHIFTIYIFGYCFV